MRAPIIVDIVVTMLIHAVSQTRAHEGTYRDQVAELCFTYTLSSGHVSLATIASTARPPRSRRIDPDRQEIIDDLTTTGSRH